MFSAFKKHITQTPDGVVLPVVVGANASKNSVEIVDDVVKLKIAAPAVDGKANKAIVKFLSDYFKVPKSKIQIIKGEKSKHKVILIKK